MLFPPKIASKKLQIKHIVQAGLAICLIGCLPLVALSSGQESEKAEGQAALTLEEAIRLALANNEVSLISYQELEVAQAGVGEARSSLLPQIVGTGTYTRRPFEVTRQVGDQTMVIQKYNALAGVAQFNLNLFSPSSIPDLKQALAKREATRMTSAETRRQLTFEVSNYFLASLSSQYLHQAALHRQDYARQVLQAARARFQAGLVSSNDVTQAELEYATAELSITQAEGQVKNNLIQLGYLLNDENTINKTLTPPEFLIKASEEEFPEPEKMVVEAQARRLDVNSLKYDLKAARALSLVPRLSYLPALSLTGQIRYTNEPGLTGKSVNWNVGMALSWNIFDGLYRESSSRLSRALAAEADLNLQSNLRRVEVEIRNALVALQNQQAAWKQASVAYEIARKNAQETNELYRQGLTSILQVEQASLSLFEAEVGLIQQRFGLGQAYLNLESALGLDPFGQSPDN